MNEGFSKGNSYKLGCSPTQQEVGFEINDSQLVYAMMLGQLPRRLTHELTADVLSVAMGLCHGTRSLLPTSAIIFFL